MKASFGNNGKSYSKKAKLQELMDDEEKYKRLKDIKDKELERER